MAIKEKEYVLSVNKFKEPRSVEEHRAVGLLLVRLILMDPGCDPLHPKMGVAIRKYRYGLNNIETLRKDVQDQIDTYLPCFPNATVNIIITPDKICNIEITIDEVKYVFDSAQSGIPITLNDIQIN